MCPFPFCAPRSNPLVRRASMQPGRRGHPRGRACLRNAAALGSQLGGAVRRRVAAAALFPWPPFLFSLECRPGCPQCWTLHWLPAAGVAVQGGRTRARLPASAPPRVSVVFSCAFQPAPLRSWATHSLELLPRPLRALCISPLLRCRLLGSSLHRCGLFFGCGLPLSPYLAPVLGF